MVNVSHFFSRCHSSGDLSSTAGCTRGCSPLFWYSALQQLPPWGDFLFVFYFFLLSFIFLQIRIWRFSRFLELSTTTNPSFPNPCALQRGRLWGHAVLSHEVFCRKLLWDGSIHPLFPLIPCWMNPQFTGNQRRRPQDLEHLGRALARRGGQDISGARAANPSTMQELEGLWISVFFHFLFLFFLSYFFFFLI